MHIHVATSESLGISNHKYCTGTPNGNWRFSFGRSTVGKARVFPHFAGSMQQQPLSSCFPRVLQHLEHSHWLDRCTRSLFVEFVVFNANVNLFCAVTLILESSNVGTKASSLPCMTWVSQKSQFLYLIPLKGITVVIYNF